jgi:ArsR family transcriptional regulator
MSKQLPLADMTVRCSPLVREPLTEPQATDLAAVFKALGDPVRLRLLSLIASHAGGEACVCDISPVVDVSQPTVSHHLKVLRAAGLLESERRASWVFYRVIPGALDAAASALRTGALPEPTVELGFRTQIDA